MKPSPEELEALLKAGMAAPDAGRCDRTEALARFAAGEMDAAEREEMSAHLAQCLECRTDLARFEASAADWDEVGSEGAFGWRRLLRLPALAAVAACAAVAVLVMLPRADHPAGGTLRAKGAWQLHVGAERQGKVLRLHEGARVLEGDRLGFFYSSDKPGYLGIVYADEQGELVQLFPAGAAASASIQPGREVRLPDGAVLSGGQGCEWIIGFYSGQPLSREQMLKAAGRMVEQRSACQLGGSALSEASTQVLGVRR